jgi:hypothetical protein
MRIGIDQSTYAGWSPALDQDGGLVVGGVKVVAGLITFGQFFAR